MKHRTRLIATIGYIVMLATGFAAGAAAQEFNTNPLDITFLDLRLGTSITEVDEVLITAKNQVSFLEQSEFEGLPTIIVSGNHALDGADMTGFSFWNEKLTCVTVSFKMGNDNTLYDTWKQRLTELYGATTKEIPQNGGQCLWSKGGMAVALSYHPGDNGSRLLGIMAIHEGIMARHQHERSSGE